MKENIIRKTAFNYENKATKCIKDILNEIE